MPTVTQDLLTRLQKQHDGCSVYELHNILGLSKSAIYQMADGSVEMQGDTLMIACDILGEDVRPWLVRIELTRCRSPKRRQILKRILDDYDTPATRAMAGAVAFLALVPWPAFPL